jgi:hypothetical protein
MHTPEKESLVEAYCPKVFFACLVPERVFMLTLKSKIVVKYNNKVTY